MPDNNRGRLIVAIDGPSGAGKSTVARNLARELGYLYLDTGAMYRAVALKVVESRVDPADEKKLRKILEDMRVKLIEEGNGMKLLLNDRDVTEEIRTPEMSQMASRISELKAVRERMVEIQRAMAAEGGLVAEGRDIGTVVFPQAEVKIYLDASEPERARRRFQELLSHGKQVTLENTQKEMHERDRRDKERLLSPLRKAEDAIVVDSTSMGVESVLAKIIKEVKNKMAEIQ
ncbi:MAG: (d)CMP kinase [Deltaproteobacteria bacterium]|nr:(d)CMP kinase [Deltaproteobacteria bacterium]